MRIFKNSVYTGLALLLFVTAGAGCASTRQTKTTETTTVQAPAVADEPHTMVVEENTTTTTSTETRPQETGIVGGLFHIIGSVIAFPFIVIGGLLRMIF